MTDPPRWAVQKALLAMAQPMVHKTAHKMAHEMVHKMACEMVHETAHEMAHKMAHKTALLTRLGMVLPSANKRVLLTRPVTFLGTWPTFFFSFLDRYVLIRSHDPSSHDHLLV